MAISKLTNSAAPKSDKVAKRIVGQATSFNRAKERVAVWSRLKRKAQEEKWDESEAKRRFGAWKQQQVKGLAPAATPSAGTAAGEVPGSSKIDARKDNSKLLSSLPRRSQDSPPRLPKAKAADIAAKVRRLDSSSDEGGAPVSNMKLWKELEAKRLKRERKHQKKEQKKLEKKIKKAAKKEKKAEKKRAKKEMRKVKILM